MKLGRYSYVDFWNNNHATYIEVWLLGGLIRFSIGRHKIKSPYIKKWFCVILPKPCRYR